MKYLNKTLISIMLLLLIITTQAQNETEILNSYNRAALIQKSDSLGWFLNEAIYPHWIGDSDQFWYTKATKRGKQYLLADANKAEITELFDHADLAVKLASQTKFFVDFNRLLLSGIKVSLSPKTIEFLTLGKYWKYNIMNKTLEELKPAMTATAEVLVSPNDKKAAFIRDYNIWIRNLETGKEEQLTTDGEKYYAYGANPDATGRPAQKPQAIWSPDSKKLLTIQTDDRQVLDLPVIDFAPADQSVRPKVINYKTALPGDVNITGFRMCIINVETKKQVSARYPNLPAVRMNDTPIDGNRAWWNNNSKTAYFVDIERGEKAVHLVNFDTETGATKVLFNETTEEGYLELGSSVYTPTSLVHLQETEEMIWYSERSGFAHLYLYDLKTEKLKRQLTNGDWIVRDVLGVDNKRREIYISRGEVNSDIDPYYRQIARVNLDTGKMTELSNNDFDHLVTQESDIGVFFYALINGDEPKAISGLSPTGNYYVETVQRIDKPSTSFLRNREGKEVLTIAQSDTSQLPKDIIWPEPFRVLAADGKTSISGALYRPSNFTPEGKYPIIDYIYGGPQVSNVPESFSNSNTQIAQALAELGFMVVIIDGRGTAERNRKFHEASYGAAETASNLEDQISGIKQMAERYPYMDTTRVGIYGFSGGGYMTASAMLRFPEFFKVGVAGSGNHDQRLFWHTWGERYQALLDGDNYLPQANLTYAKNLKGKLLFIHGLLDFGVHPGGLFQLTQALMNENKDFDLVILPQAGHELPGYALRHMWDYFVVNLAKQQPPKDFRVKGANDFMKETMMADQMQIMGMGLAPQATLINCIVKTSEGDFEIELYGDKAPITVANFMKYVDSKKYDNSSFFRATTKENEADKDVKIEVIQGGNMEEKDSYSPISLETTKLSGIKHVNGTLSMARAEPNTATSSFFICINDQPELDYNGKRNPDGQGFSAFGKVTKGMDVVLKIQQKENEKQMLKKAVEIYSIERINN